MRLELFAGVSAALLALAVPGHSAIEVYVSPQDDGVNPGHPGRVPEGGLRTQAVYVDAGGVETQPANAKCAGPEGNASLVGDEVCFWRLRVVNGVGLSVVGFDDTSAADIPVVNNQALQIDLNAGEPLAGRTNATKVGDFDVSCLPGGVGAQGTVTGDWVDTTLVLQSVAAAPLWECCSDPDGDQACDAVTPADDPCPGFTNTTPLNGGTDCQPTSQDGDPVDPNADCNGDGIPNECQCGDISLNGSIDTQDALFAFNCIDPPNLPASVCDPPQATGIGDSNDNGIYDTQDALLIFNAQPGGAFPPSFLRCANRPSGEPFP